MTTLTIELDEPPEHLSKGALQLFMSLQADYGIYDSAGIALLTCAAECWDRCRSAREIIEKDGDFVTDRYGAIKIHPAIRVERDSQSRPAAR